MVVAAAFLTVFMVMFVVVIVMMVVLMLLSRVHDLSQYLSRQRVAVLHDRQQLRTGQLIPRSRHDTSILVVLAQQGNDLFQTVFLDKLGTGEQDGTRVLDLIEEEFAEVLGVHLGLLGVDNRDKAVEDDRLVLCNALHGSDDVGQLADTRGLDQNACRVVGLDDFLQCLAEVTDQRAADAARVHLGDLDTGILEEAAVNADLAELVLDQHDLFTLERFGQQAADQGRLARAQETGNNINLGHKKRPLSKRLKNSSAPIIPRLRQKIKGVFVNRVEKLVKGNNGAENMPGACVPRAWGFRTCRRRPAGRLLRSRLRPMHRRRRSQPER